MPTRRVVALLLDEDRRALVAAARTAAAVARAAERVADALERGGRVVFMGAGTSGRLGVLEAAELPPTFGIAPRQAVAVMAGGPRAVFRAAEGAEDRRSEGQRRGRALRRQDVLVGISASSVTPFVRGALAAAHARGAATILVTCAPAPDLVRLADVVVAVRTGPEVLTGSTRLKAGSATKAVLNALTTAAMVRLGKAYDNLMVDLRPTSAKLRDRALRLVAAATGAGRARAGRLLAAAGGEVKTAIVMGSFGVSATAARKRLRAARGELRSALAYVARPRSSRKRGSSRSDSKAGSPRARSTV
jgi:N-acetylmuramic acid 6-phosphate etherase